MASLARPSSLARLPHPPRTCRSSQPCLASIPQSRRASTAAAAANMRNLPKQESMASRMKRLKRSEIPTDIGILPQTFVRPCGEMPSWFTQPRTRLSLEWLYVKQSAMDFGRMVYTRRWAGDKDPLTGKRQKLPLACRERYAVARDLHTKLYTAIAAGDKAAIRKIACSGLENQQLGRIDRRRMLREPAESWSVKYNGWVVTQKLRLFMQTLIPSWFKAIQVVSDREFQIPIGPGITYRQVVVRVDSEQTRDKKDGSKPMTKKLREYLVLQQTVNGGEMGDWKIWGTIAPTDVPTALQILKDAKSQAAGAGVMERARAGLNML